MVRYMGSIDPVEFDHKGSILRAESYITFPPHIFNMPFILPDPVCSHESQVNPLPSPFTTAKMPLRSIFSRKSRNNSGVQIGQIPPPARTGTQSSNISAMKSSFANPFRSSATRRPGTNLDVNLISSTN